jgi:hypothetical protein
LGFISNNNVFPVLCKKAKKTAYYSLSTGLSVSEVAMADLHGGIVCVERTAASRTSNRKWYSLNNFSFS